MTETPCYTRLENRGLIHIEGQDAHKFLQDLITNDMNKLEDGKLLYACLLTPQGKFLHDFFVHKGQTQNGENFYLLDCEGAERAQDLFKRLNMYRLRADVQINVEENVPVYAVLGAKVGLKDPRHADMGYRSFDLPSEALAKEGKPNDLEEAPFEVWDTHRIKLTVPDGSRDLVPEKSTMDEAHMDTLNAVDYNKGCYVGQELTARMHYRGLGKKHLQTVNVNALPEKAELRSSCGDIGIALVRN